MLWDDHYKPHFGPWRPNVTKVIIQYLACGDLHFGFARVKCTECHHEYLLPFSCKRRHFCSSCHHRRVIEFGSWLCQDVLKAIPHLHIIATDGCFYNDGRFSAGILPNVEIVKGMFRQEAFKMLKSEGKIGDVLIENMMNWRHTGFNVYCGDPIWPTDQQGLENLSRYIIRASFSQKRMTYIPSDDDASGQARVIYHPKDGSTSESFDALDWLAQLTCHIPNRYRILCTAYQS